MCGPVRVRTVGAGLAIQPPLLGEREDVVSQPVELKACRDGAMMNTRNHGMDREDLGLPRIHRFGFLHRRPLRRADQDRQHADRQESGRGEVQQPKGPLASAGQGRRGP